MVGELLLQVNPDWAFKIIDISVALGVALIILWWVKKQLDKKDLIIIEKDKEIARLYEASKTELKEGLKILIRVQDFIDNKGNQTTEKFSELKLMLKDGFDRLSGLIDNLNNK